MELARRRAVRITGATPDGWLIKKPAPKERYYVNGIRIPLGIYNRLMRKVLSKR